MAPPPPPPALPPPSAGNDADAFDAADAADAAAAADDATRPLPPTTWTAAEIDAARWPTSGGEPVWRAAPVADDYALSPAAAAAVLAARATAPGGGAAAAAAAVPPSSSSSASVPLFYGYPHYAPEDRYVPRIQADGGVLSDWKPMYAPTKEQAEADRDAAFAAGVPFGSSAAPATTTDDPAAAADAAGQDPPPERLLRLRVVSELHTDDEYGPLTRPDGSRHGGEVTVELPAGARVEAARLAIRRATGVPPALCRLSYAGARLQDAQRTLGHYGVAYWHAKFPHWPLVITRF